jgi:hypothetical protein
MTAGRAPKRRGVGGQARSARVWGSGVRGRFNERPKEKSLATADGADKTLPQVVETEPVRSTESCSKGIEIGMQNPKNLSTAVPIHGSATTRNVAVNHSDDEIPSGLFFLFISARAMATLEFLQRE